ncbi:MAG: PhnD/SsuA/transferrin family substrate-binding protein [Pseudomonadota bacterium]
MDHSEATMIALTIKAGNTRWCRVLALGLLLVVSCWSMGGAVDLEPTHIHFGFSASAFSGVNRNDAEAAFKAFLISVGRRRGYDLQVSTQIFDDPTDFETAINQGKVQLAIINTWSFIGMEIREVAEPLFSTIEDGITGYRYLLLTAREGREMMLGDLRGKEIPLMNAGRCALMGVWLDTLLMGNGVKKQSGFFSRMEGVDKPSAAVLPVFFGKKTACVVDEGGFRIMKELNPQIGEKLQVAATSEPLLAHVLCLARSWPQQGTLRQDSIQALRELDREPAGKQVMTLFKISGLAPFQETHLDTVRRLRTAHNQRNPRDRNSR